MPRQTQPDAIRLSYFRALLQVLAQARALVERATPKLRDIVERAAAARGDSRLDDDPDDPNDLIDGLSDEFFGEFTNTKLSDLAKGYGQRTSDFNRLELGRQFKSALGIDIVKAEPWLEPKIQTFTRENVALIKSIPNRYFDDVEKQVVGGMRQGLRWEEIAKELDRRFEVAEGHAKLVARDQVGKFFGDLNRTRQEELGVTSFIWRTARDNRVREEHQELEGEEFTWANPPAEGIPGEPINCRCQAEPVMKPLIEAIKEPVVTLPAVQPSFPKNPVIKAPPAPAAPPVALPVEQLAVERKNIVGALPYEEATAWHAEMAPAATAWRATLPKAEASALSSYQGSGYSRMNRQLRTGAIEDRIALERLTRVVKKAPPLPRDVWVWRGFRYAELARDPVGLLQRKGRVLQDQGFVSTSIHSGRALSFAGSDSESSVLVHLKLPAGTRTPYLTGSAGGAYEYELLLQREAEFRVTKVYKTKDGFTVLDAEHTGSKPKPLPRSKKKDRADADAGDGERKRADKFVWTEEDLASGGLRFRHE